MFWHRRKKVPAYGWGCRFMPSRCWADDSDPRRIVVREGLPLGLPRGEVLLDIECTDENERALLVNLVYVWNLTAQGLDHLGPAEFLAVRTTLGPSKYKAIRQGDER